MCSTNVTNFLEALLQVPGIDINKPDNELNTPLHYASECGKVSKLCFDYINNFKHNESTDSFAAMNQLTETYSTCFKQVVYFKNISNHFSCCFFFLMHTLFT